MWAERANKAPDLASGPGNSVNVLRDVHARWGPGGSGSCSPHAALLCGCIDLFESSLVLCVCAAPHDRVVSPWRPGHLAGGCKHAHQSSSSAVANGLVQSSAPASQVISKCHLYGRLCILLAGPAGAVHILLKTDCPPAAWASACCAADTRGGPLGLQAPPPAYVLAMWMRCCP
jgi:hypothetical protein